MDRRSRDGLLYALIEVVFAVLPLLVLLFFWQPGVPHFSLPQSPNQQTEPEVKRMGNAPSEFPSRFTQLPEISLTSMVLYGLALSKFVQGMLTGASSTKRSPAAVGAIAMVPIIGVVASAGLAIKICDMVTGFVIEGMQLVNLVFAILVMILLGGYGMSRSRP
jgi:ABC-type amino acid transport system permease subunit